jgi:hypothetical protein
MLRGLHEWNIYPAVETNPLCNGIAGSVDFLSILEVLWIVSVVRPHYREDDSKSTVALNNAMRTQRRSLR